MQYRMSPFVLSVGFTTPASPRRSTVYIAGIRSTPERAVRTLLGYRGQQRRGRPTLEARLATRRDKLQHIVALLATGRYHRQNGRHIPATLDTGCPITALPPQHRMPQRTLGRVIGRL